MSSEQPAFARNAVADGRLRSEEDVADRFLDSLTSRFLLLTQHPYLGRKRDDDLRPGVCSLQKQLSS